MGCQALSQAARDSKVSVSCLFSYCFQRRGFGQFSSGFSGSILLSFRRIFEQVLIICGLTCDIRIVLRGRLVDVFCEHWDDLSTFGRLCFGNRTHVEACLHQVKAVPHLIKAWDHQ